MAHHHCNGVRIPDRVINALRQAGQIRGLAVRAGQTVILGAGIRYTNNGRVSTHLVVPVSVQVQPVDTE